MSFLHKNLTHFKEDLEQLLELFVPYSRRIYIVGGAIRDILLNITPLELDIEIYDIEPQKFEVLAKKIGAIGVGKSFFVYKWRNFDISLPRIERKIANSHQGFKVALCNDEKEASFRRDFTMNSLMLNVFSGEILDFWGGKKDIQCKTIRYINKEKFSEDSLRVLRGIQFASRFGFMIDKKCLHVMQSIDLENLSPTRIFWELEKFFCSCFIELGTLLGFKIALWDKLFKTSLSFEEVFQIANEIKKMRLYAPTHLKRYIFLYIFVNELKLDMKSILNTIQAPKHYYTNLLSSPYLKLPISDKKLLKISLDMPLKHWVGICQNGLIQRAKELDIYEAKFHGGIFSKDVIKDGFKGAKISKEIRRRKEEKILEIVSK